MIVTNLLWPISRSVEWSEHWGGEVVRAGVASPLAEDENDERDAEDDDDDDVDKPTVDDREKISKGAL